jgi:ornithine carbamoyltransferase
MRHFLDVNDLSSDELAEVLRRAVDPTLSRPLEGAGVALVFEKPSARTRNSMEMAVTQLGGHPVYIQGQEVGFDVRESVEDVTRTLACFHSMLCARVFSHDVVERMAAVDIKPVVNMLSDRAHPLQALADVLTLQTEFGDLKGRSVAYVGDANNVTRSLALAASALGMQVRVGHPEGYGFDDTDLAVMADAGVDLVVTNDPIEAVKDSAAVYADVWTSMGQEEEKLQRLEDFAGWTIDSALMGQAADDAIFLHCLPAHEGEECTRKVLDSPASRIWPQAENRMHAARGLLHWLTT